MTALANLDLWDAFSHREQQCVAFLVAGKSKKEIGRELNISPDTVKVHIHHAFKKANVHGSEALIARLYRLEMPKITHRPHGVHASRGTERAA